MGPQRIERIQNLGDIGADRSCITRLGLKCALALIIAISTGVDGTRPARAQDDFNDTFPEIDLPPLEEDLAEPDAANEPPLITEDLPPALDESRPAIDSSFSDSFPDDRETGFDENVAEEGIDAGPTDPVQLETIRERFADGKVHIERSVTQDEEQNYVNHGPWKRWDEAGNLVEEGNYSFGMRDGEWMRVVEPKDGAVYGSESFRDFSPPFVSRATFRGDVLDGVWSISDRNDRRMVEWEFADGHRHGASTWWYVNGNRMRQLEYRDGQVDGELTEWDESGAQTAQVTYQQGRRHSEVTRDYREGQRQYQGMVLHARLIMKRADDWDRGTLATYVQEGRDEKHGPWQAWYPTGQVRFSGTYEHDQPQGTLTWWHANGQRMLESNYQSGAKSGEWTWWHANGQKSIQGQYSADVPTGAWIWWHESGQVARRVTFAADGTVEYDSNAPERADDADTQSIVPNGTSAGTR